MFLRARDSGFALWPALLVTAVSLLAGCGGGGGDDDPIPAQPAPTVQSVQVAPATASIAKGTTQAFTATAILSDNTTQDVTNTATWSSSNPTVAPVSNLTGSKGRATGNNTGNTTISASFDGKTGSAALTITPATVTSVEVTPSNRSIAKGTTQQFTATAIFTDLTNQNVTDTATWSSDAAAATVSNTAGSKGLATGQAVGPANITASFGGRSGSTSLTVTPATLTAVQVTPTNPSIAKGTAQLFAATAVFSDATTQNVTTTANWSSSNTAVATVSNTAGTKGLANGVAVGSASISAQFNGVSGSTTLTVTAAVVNRVDVTPANPSIPKGASQQFVATAVFTDGTNQVVTADAGTVWSSSDTGVAQVSNAAASKGFAIASGEGSTTISAAFSGRTGSTTLTVTPAVITSIQVTPENENLPVGFTQQYAATGTLSDGTTRDVTNEVTWVSTEPSKATIDNAVGSKGLATGVAAGVTTITALAGPVQDSTQLTVRAATLSSIDVTPDAFQLPLGRAQAFLATGTFSDASTEDLTTHVTWASSNPGFATVSNAAGSKGRVQSVAQGTTTLTATYPGTTVVVGTEDVTVVDAVLDSIVITPDPASVPKGRTQQFTAMGTFSNNTVSDITGTVTWSSSTPAVATIAAATGLATAVATGTTTIKAESGTIADTATMNVTAAVLDKIDVTPSTASIAKGRTQQFVATGTFSDNSTMNLTATATWSSSATAVATVSNAAGSQGRATGIGLGSTDITASSAGVTSPAAALTVTAAELDSIAITPANPSVPKGLSRQLTATGTFSDATTQDLTTFVTWSSSDNSKATVSNAPGTHGLLLAREVGTAVISATDSASGKVGTTTATISPATVTGVVVTPANATLPQGLTLQYTATAQFSDGGMQNVTTDQQTSWSSANPGVANVSNAAGSKGVATAMAAGATSIRATFGVFSGAAALTVTSETLSSIDVTPKNQTIGNGGTLQYTATGLFSGGTSADLTTQVTWSSSNTNAATISNAAGTKGRASAGPLPGATTTISAALSGKTGSTTLTRGIP